MPGWTRELKFPQHFDGKRFYNPNARQAPGVADLLKWKLTSRPARSPRFVADVAPCVPPRRVQDGALRVTLVNHSTVLLQQPGCNMLTDPIWSKRASPLSWIGPARRRKPGVSLSDLPRIDMVLLSHNHYDHLDIEVLRRLAARGASIFIIPVGVGRLLGASHIGPAHELNWGESVSLEAVTVHCVPAVHFSGRGLFDRNTTLWCGYVIECQGSLVYFAGDTAFGPHFASIREAFGRLRLALLPVGAYQPRWFMSRIHMDPGEAMEAHQILGAQTSVAIHHGTFQLTDESLDAPARQIRECGPPEFLTLNNGQYADIP